METIETSLKNNKNERTVIRSFVFWLSGVVIFMAIDQLTKAWTFSLRDKWLLRGIGKVNFENVNFAFSLPLPGWFMGAVYAVVLLAIASYLVKHFYSLPSAHKLAWALIVAGAASNVGERVIRGSVRDFVYLFSGIFNVADAFIIIGIIILLVTGRVVHKADKLVS